MPASPKTNKDVITLLLCGLMLTAAALIFSAIGDAPHVLYMTVGGLALSLMIRKPLSRSTRTYVYSGVIVAFLTVLQNQLFTVDVTRFFLLPAELYCPILLFLGMILTFFDQRETTVAAIVGSSLLAMMIAGNTLGALQPNTRFELGNFVLEHLHVFYAAASLVQVSAVLAVLARNDPRRRQGHEPGKYRVRRTATVAIALVITFAGAMGLGGVALANSTRIQNFLRGLFRLHMRGRSRQIVFPQEVDLWRTLPLKSRNDRTIVLRVKSEAAPGYLRGRVYEYYDRGRWTFGNDRELLPSELPEGNVTFTLFSRPGYPVPENAPRQDVFAQVSLLSDVLFAPGAAGEFILVAEELQSDSNGTLTATDWDSTGGYTVLTRPYNMMSAFPRPGPLEMSEGRYLGLPAVEREDFIQSAAEVFNPEAEGGTRRRIRELESFFAENFRYRLGVRMRGSQDPALQFLTRQRHGHCELFATGAALLLRTQGIRTRYVTGFVSAEKHPFANYWLARLEDAHAWVEAFVPEENRWVVVEATPPSGIPQNFSRFNWLTGVFDQLGLYWKDLIAQLKRGYAADVLIRAFLVAWAGLLWVVLNPLRGGLIIVIAVGFYVRRKQALREKRLAMVKHLPVTVQQLREALDEIEKQLGLRNIHRQPHMTLRDLASDIEPGETQDHGLRAVADLLMDYETLRYPATAPSESAVKAFADQARNVLHQLQRPTRGKH